VTNRSKKAHASTEATNQNTQTVRSNKANKSKKQTNVVTDNNVQVNKKEFKHFKRSGNEVSFSVARNQIVRTHHDRNWWRSHYSRIVYYGGGYWYWNAGWWYPAWGYTPYYNSYIYNGPIFGYGGVFPGDVTSEVQRALAVRGYYYGPIDGILGPATRAAIQRYQIDRGLYVTAAIDEPTLATLGLT
jgi:lysozyme family protein